jgi:hypothetical protein
MCRRAIHCRLPFLLNIALTSATAMTSHGQTLLRYKYVPGDTKSYVLRHRAAVRQSGTQQEVPVEQQVQLKRKVLSIDENGDAEIEESIGRFVFVHPQGKYDSASPERPPESGPAVLVARFARALIDNPGRRKLSPRGETLEQHNPRLEKAIQTAEPIFGFLRGLQGQPVDVIFPEEPIRPGHTWTQKVTLDLPGGIGRLVLKPPSGMKASWNTNASQPARLPPTRG